MTTIANNLAQVRQRIQSTCEKAGRDPHSVVLLAVSKTQSVEALLQAHAAGQVVFAENYLQEALTKIEILKDYPLEWHYIGPIQSNKTKAIAEHFSWVHSIASLKIAERLNQQRPEDMAPLQICLQVNISDESSKFGVSTAELEALAQKVDALPLLRLRGLMAIPKKGDSESAFIKLRQCQERLIQKGLALDTLSMGMSADLEPAIMAGSTIVRVGTDIFGARV